MAYNVMETCMLVNLGLTRSECASWVQAWGSLLAVVGAAVGIWWQIRRQADSQSNAVRAEEIRKLKLVAAEIFHCRVVIEQWQDEPAYSVGEDLDAFKLKLQQLRAISPLDFPEWRALHGVDHAVATFTGYYERIKKADNAASRRDVQDREKFLNVVLIALEMAEELTQQALIDRNSDVEPIRFDFGEKSITSRSYLRHLDKSVRDHQAALP